MDTVGSGLPVHVGQPCVLDQHRKTALGQVARPADHHVQPEASGGQAQGTVVQPPEVSISNMSSHSPSTPSEIFPQLFSYSNSDL